MKVLMHLICSFRWQQLVFQTGHLGHKVILFELWSSQMGMVKVSSGVLFCIINISDPQPWKVCRSQEQVCSHSAVSSLEPFYFASSSSSLGQIVCAFKTKYKLTVGLFSKQRDPGKHYSHWFWFSLFDITLNWHILDKAKQSNLFSTRACNSEATP